MIATCYSLRGWFSYIINIHNELHSIHSYHTCMSYKEMHSFHTCTIVLNTLVFETSHEKGDCQFKKRLLWKWNNFGIFKKRILIMHLIWMEGSDDGSICYNAVRMVGLVGGQLVYVTSLDLGCTILSPRRSWRGWTSPSTCSLHCIIPMPRREKVIMWL